MDGADFRAERAQLRRGQWRELARNKGACRRPGIAANNFPKPEELEMLSLIKKMAATQHKRRVRRAAIGDLSALSDRTLKDIGIHRSQILSLVEERLQWTEISRDRPAPDVNAQTTTANVPTPFAHDLEHKTAA